jgi:hypothetical protein
MSFLNYTDLVTNTPVWFKDRTDLATYMPDFITLAEGYLNYGMGEDNPPLRVLDMETVVSLVSVNGVAALPSDYLQYRRVVPATGNRYPILYTTPDGADELYPTGQAGLPKHFTIVGSNLYTYPKTSDNVELTYYARIPALTASAPTNWLMTKNPAIYLRATLMQAADFIDDEAETQKQAIICRSLMNGMQNSDSMANYARAGVTLRGNTP